VLQFCGIKWIIFFFPKIFNYDVLVVYCCFRDFVPHFSLSFLKFWMYEITFPNVKRKNDTRLPYRNILNLIRMLMVETHFMLPPTFSLVIVVF